MTAPATTIATSAAAVTAVAQDAKLALSAARKQNAGAERELLDLVSAVIEAQETVSRVAVLLLWVLERRRAGPWRPAGSA